MKPLKNLFCAIALVNIIFICLSAGLFLDKYKESLLAQIAMYLVVFFLPLSITIIQTISFYKEQEIDLETYMGDLLHGFISILSLGIYHFIYGGLFIEGGFLLTTSLLVKLIRKEL
jgi:hypothetical protein